MERDDDKVPMAFTLDTAARRLGERWNVFAGASGATIEIGGAVVCRVESYAVLALEAKRGLDGAIAWVRRREVSRSLAEFVVEVTADDCSFDGHAVKRGDRIRRRVFIDGSEGWTVDRDGDPRCNDDALVMLGDA